MSAKNTPKKNGDLIRTSSQQQEIEDDVLLTQVHKLQFDRPGSSRAETTRLQEEEVVQSYDRPARRMLPDEPRDSVKDEKNSDGDDSFSFLSSQDQDYFGDMLSSQVSIVLTGAEVTLDESSGLQNAMTTSVAGDSNDNDIAASNWPTAMADRLSVLVGESPMESGRSGFDGVTGQPLVEIDSSAAVQSLTLTNAAGQALNGEYSGLLTLSGQSIFLFTDTQDPNLVLGKTDTGQVVMAVYLSPTGPDLHAADVWTVLYQPLQHPDANVADEAVSLAGKLFVTAETSGGSNMLVSGPSGQNLFLMLGNHEEAVVVSGVHPANQSQGISLNQGDTVNSSQADEHLAIGTNNQMVDGPGVNKSGGVTQGGEGLVITYVTGAHDQYTSLQLSPTEADVEANIQFDGLKDSTHAIVGVNQLQPVKAATVKITALVTGYEPGVQFVDGLLTNDTAVGITRVVVMDAQHNVLEDSNGSVNSASISISFSGGSATVSGITAGQLIAFDTVTVHNRVLIENPGNADPYLSSSFDLGYFSWGESASTTLDIGSAVRFEDAAPSADENLVVQLDDDALAGGIAGGDGDLNPDVQNVTGILSHSYDADGGSITWLTTGSPVGFTYVVDGNQLFIEQGETTVMTLTLNTTTGAYTVEQNAPLMHPEGLNENNQNFNVTYQITDSDGDTAAGQLAITVNDDSPTVSENLMVILDDDALPNGNPGGVNDLSPDTENATGILGYSYGADGGSMTWLDSGASDGFTYVVDGNQLFIEQGETTVMTLTLDTTTGAYTVEQNAPLMHPEGLNENNQNFNVTYQITDSDGDTAAGQLAITVNDDTPTVSENLMVIFDDDALAGGNPAGVNDLSPDTENATGALGYSYGADGGSMIWLDSGAPDGFTYVVDGNQLFIEQGETTVMTLTLDTTTGAYTVEQNAPLMHPEGLNENNQNFNVTYQITDSDGDTAAGQLAITVNDDTPTVSANLMVILDDDALPNGNPGGVNDLSPDTENATGTLGYSYGADGGSMTWLDSGAPDGFTYVVDGNQLFIEQGETTVMTLTLDTTTGAYTVEQNAPLMHPEGLNENNQNFNVTYQVTDGDGDTAAGQLAITVNDDTPTVSANLMVILDDDALPNGNPGGVNDLSPDTENATGTLGYSYGADGGSMTWLDSGAPDGFTYVVDGNQLFIEQGETTVMTLTLDTTTGAYTVEQNAPLMHPEGLNENNQNFNVTYQVTDSDGDTAAGQLAITVNDDTPIVSENLVVHLDDNAMPGANPVGNEGIPPDIQNTTGTLSHSYGADGGAITWITTGSPEGFVYQADGNNLLIRQGEVTIITLSLDTATGEYLAVQHVAIMNAPVPGENSQDFQVHYNVTDSDGDISTGQLAITVKDDTPHGSFNEINLLDDDALAGGNPGGIGDVAPDTAFATGNLDFAFGADGGSIAWLTTGALDGFSYEADGTSLLVKQAGTLVLTLTLDPVSAAYTVVQNSAIQHVPGLDENSQAFTMNYNVLDNDGDSAIGQFYITVNDDTATVGENLMVHLDDDALPGGNPVGNEGIPPDVQNTSGTLAHSYGADGGTIAWATTGAPDGFNYQADGSSLLIRQGDTTIITLSLDTATGDYIATQNAALINVSGLGENNQDFQVYYNVTDGDGDITTGQLAITVNDDTPHGSFNEINLLDDDALAGGNPGGIGDVAPDTAFATGNLDFAFGADGGSIAWLTTGAPDGFTYEADGTSLLVKQVGTLVLTLTLDPVSAAYTVVQNSAIQHVSGLDENSQAFTMNYNVLDNDGDPAIGQFYITVNDDTPVVTQLNDVLFQNTDNPVPGGDSQFTYSIGADKRSTFSNVDSDFSMFSLRGEVGINSITNTHITWYAEDTTSAVFRFDFDYQSNEASPSTAHAMGTLMFDKAEGNYHINLDQSIQGFNILTTSSALSITGYEANSTQVDKTQPAVSVAELSDGAYVQFTSASEPGGGTGSNNLQVNGVDGDSSHWAAGELFSQSTGWVSISNLSNGVNGDTMQKGEVLNLSLFDFNPYGNLNASPNAGASGMFLKMDGIGSEDLVVVLKLVDTETLEATTRALIIDNSDILKLGNVLTPDYHIVLDNNDGAVIIESNDFNGVGEHFVMTGAQILTSTEGITGSALNFNSQTGVSGASSTAQSFGITTTDGDVIKISDIGIMTNQTSTLDSHLEFKFAIKDADLDATPTQTLNAYIAGSDVNPLATLM